MKRKNLAMQTSPDTSSADAFDGIRAVSPALERYTTDVLLGNVCKRPQLSARDRSIVTLAVLIARNQSAELPFYLDLALDSGLEPGEISELITHLAFYSGWANARAAVKATKPVFERRAITPAQLAPASVDLLPLDPAAVAPLETAEQYFGAVAPGLVHFSTDVLFGNLWLRRGLSTRDRSLATVSTVDAKYNFAIDEGNAEEWASCFPADGAFNAAIEGEQPRGTEQLKAFVPTGTTTFGTMYHFTTNEIISADGENARQKCYLQFFSKRDGAINGYICVYDDWLKRENGAWKYNRRDVISKDQFSHLAA
jgi:4-carboxymuconolactone decarboxylase